jgi:hypothetical protein
LRVRDLATQLIWDLDVKHFVKFRRFAHSNFGKVPPAGQQSRQKILVEFNSLFFSYPGYLYLVKALGGGNSADMVAYSAYGVSRPIMRAWFQVRRILRLGKFGAYRAMGTTEFLLPSFSAEEEANAEEQAKGTLSKIDEKKDLERLSIDGVWVGDLIYGSYVAMYREPTIKFDDERLKELVKKYILLLRFWKAWMTTHKVRAVLSSHLVYEMGIPTRVANSMGIEGFFFPDLGNALARVTSANPHLGSEHKNFPEYFRALDTTSKVRGLQVASDLLEKRFRGEGAFNLNARASRSYSEDAKLQDLPFLNDGKLRVLISPHLFWDSPHMYGEALFPDIYEWLYFLGEISKETDYAWYLKPHPDGTDSEEKVIFDGFKEKYPHITFLPRDQSHHAILAQGVDLVLTVHGQIALEYPYHGIAAVNASLVNPHAAYKFSITPRSVEELATVLTDFKNYSYVPNRDEILEFYFMQSVFFSPNVFFSNHEESLKQVYNQSSPTALSLWLDQHTHAQHEKLMMGITNFVNGDEIRLYWKHFGHKSPTLEVL